MSGVAAFRARLKRIEQQRAKLDGDELQRLIASLPLSTLFELSLIVDNSSEALTSLLNELLPLCASERELVVRVVERLHASGSI